MQQKKYILQQQTKATAITKTKRSDVTLEKKTNATKKNYCCKNKLKLLQQQKQSDKMQHKKRLMQ
jgi:hypothetical protein